MLGLPLCDNIRYKLLLGVRHGGQLFEADGGVDQIAQDKPRDRPPL